MVSLSAHRQRDLDWSRLHRSRSDVGYVDWDGSGVCISVPITSWDTEVWAEPPTILTQGCLPPTQTSAATKPDYPWGTVESVISTRSPFALSRWLLLRLTMSQGKPALPLPMTNDGWWETAVAGCSSQGFLFLWFFFSSLCVYVCVR